MYGVGQLCQSLPWMDIEAILRMLTYHLVAWAPLPNIFGYSVFVL